ncbi:MAG: hypothetical protein AAB425_10805, partial [Bdellovibrionota bacterium]
NVGERPRCLGTSELDPNSPYPLQPGQTYLMRLLFGGNINDANNWVEFCYESIVTVDDDGSATSSATTAKQAKLNATAAGRVKRFTPEAELPDYLQDLLRWGRERDVSIYELN